MRRPNQKRSAACTSIMMMHYRTGNDSPTWARRMHQTYKPRSKIPLAVMYVLLGVSMLASLGKHSKATTHYFRTFETTTTVRKRIFYCGYRYPLVQYIFQGYEYVGDKPWDGDPDQNNDQDILVFGMWGPGCKIDGEVVSERTAFSGKILYINGEPSGDAVSDETFPRAYQMGPYLPKQPRKNKNNDGDGDGDGDGVDVPFWNRHSLLVYHVATTLLNDIYAPQIFSMELDQVDVNPFESSSSSPNESGETQHQKRKSDSKKKFDAWKQLTQGNGYRNNSDIPKPEDRIPAAVYVSKNCVQYRQEAAELLAREFPGPNVSTNGESNDHEHSFLHYGGVCSPNGGIPVPEGVLSDWENTNRDKFRSNYETIYTRYKYCLVMENTKKDGYITEKLLHALLGGCLPIYYGTKDVYQMFRKDSFVYFDIEQPDEALAEIRRLEANPDEYKKRTDRSRPLLKVNDDGSTSETVDKYFSLFPSIGNGGLCKKLHKMMGLPFPEIT